MPVDGEDIARNSIFREGNMEVDNFPHSAKPSTFFKIHFTHQRSMAADFGLVCYFH
jgi:hypothetical protein